MTVLITRKQQAMGGVDKLNRYIEGSVCVHVCVCVISSVFILRDRYQK